MKHTIAFTLMLVLFLQSMPAPAAESANGRIKNAKRFLSQKKPDFAFLEYRALLKDHPESPAAADAAFGLGEYYFEMRNVAESAMAFQRLTVKPTDDVSQVLALTYLLKCAELSSDEQSIKTYRTQLKKSLASKKFLMLFGEGRKQQWNSPFENRFELKEFVDRMEIYRNGSPFYTIEIP